MEKEQTLVNKGYCSHKDVFKGLDEHPDGTLVLLKKVIYELVSHTRIDGVRALGLEVISKFKEPKRNEPCFCDSGVKYKKCCWSVIN